MTRAEALPSRSVLSGIRVIEIADEQAEYCGMVLAGLGADVVKIEPPEGNPTRRIGPFYEDRPNDETSLFFWQYNRGKRSVALNLRNPSDRNRFMSLLETADVLLETGPGRATETSGLDTDALRQRFPSLIVARVSPFGDQGPWASYKGSDLVHLALGGIMMNCGYDPLPDGTYDLPPIAPQMWHAYHIVGDQLAIAIVAALLYRTRSGRGQVLSCAVHEAVSKGPEGTDLMSWILGHRPFYRQTCRHAQEAVSSVPTIGNTKDGRWMMAIPLGGARNTTMLERYGLAAPKQVDEAAGSASHGRVIPGLGSGKDSGEAEAEAARRFWLKFTYENLPWREAQEEVGLHWSPLRKPHENATDAHWLARGTFRQIEHPELKRSFPYAVSKWKSDVMPWIAGRRAPLLDEDRMSVLSAHPARKAESILDVAKEKPSPHAKPFVLDGVRIFDFSWFLATAGGTRFLAAMGAECIKVEWKGNPDTRFGAMAPVGGRKARETASAPLPAVSDPDMGGQFNNKNPGKRGISLNIRHPKGLAIAKRLVGISDIVAEGFSPGVMERCGLGYEILKSIRPDIIYAQQSGWGSSGTYGRLRAVGPTAQSFTGLSDMSGLPEPAMPAGWGYSYLDWTGAYGFALALVSALFHRARTGQGQHIDSSQCEAGLFMLGTSVLDWSANGRVFTRYGNRSPYKQAAPHGAFPCAGLDRWIAIACFTEEEWRALTDVSGHSEWRDDTRFAGLAQRLTHQDALENTVSVWTKTQEAYDLMTRLQGAGVPAGVCQTAEDRYERDPQLKSLHWLTEVQGTKIGRWPVYEVPIKLSETPFYAGGKLDRGAPCYGEDNEYVYGELLGMSTAEIAGLAGDGVI